MASFIEQAKRSCRDDWRAYVEHDFVKQLGAGTLPEACFKHYLKQDYLFLLQFARAMSLVLYKSRTLDDMRYGQSGINAILDVEIGLHLKYCERWGIDTQALDQLLETRACVAYTRYVLDCGMQGELADLHVAMAPCAIGYGDIAQWLLEQPFTVLEGNPYREWIEMYTSDEYKDVAEMERTRVEFLCQGQNEHRLAQLQQVFRTATRMEVGFWDMGLNLEE